MKRLNEVIAKVEKVSTFLRDIAVFILLVVLIFN